MKKLTDKMKYKIHPDGFAVIYAKRKGESVFVPAFVCHLSCIEPIKAANSLRVENVVLRPYSAEHHA